MKRKQQLKYATTFIVIFIIASLLLTACGSSQKTYTIGVINIVPSLDSILEGFKEGMAEAGYIEGENITYIYNGVTTDMSQLDAVAQDLVKSEVDLILTITTPATKAAQKATAGTDIPVVFVPITDPLGAGLVDSLQKPGGNTTGITFGVQEARRLGWLVKIAPTIEQVYVPYNPEDQSPVQALKTVSEAAEKLGVELITREVRNSEEITAAIENIPEEADALFMLPDGLVSPYLADIEEAALKRKLPTSWTTIEDVKSRGVLISYSFEQFSAGKQAARLADQILKGAKPADLPVETTEFFLAINLKKADAIGLDIPDEILRQADTIVR